MKKIITYYLLLIIFLSASCKKDFLDPNPTDRLSEKTVWTSQNLIEAFLTDNYQNISDGICSLMNINDDNQMLASLCDETISLYEGYEGRVLFVNGLLNPDNVENSRFNRLSWRNQYSYVAKANEFLSRMPNVTVLDDATKQRFVGEMKTLRAFRYFNLLRHFGGLPLIKKPFGLTDNFKNISRSTIDSTVQFIIGDLDSAIMILPDVAAVTGRVDKSVAQALKSRVLLYAASPLYSTSNDLNKWKAAADAAKVLIDGGRYHLEPDFNKYVNMFVLFDAASPEIIFARQYTSVDGPEYGTHQLNPPLSHGTTGAGGLSYFTPTQQMVDAYQMANGKAITDASSGYDPQNPYVNRDPRFDAFIYHNGSKLNNRVLDFSVTGADRQPGSYSNPTGYCMRKFVNETRFTPDATGIINPGINEPTPWIHIRYAEILLNYAEAINEAEGSANAYGPINLIRQRAGMPDLPAGLSQADMRSAIHNERRIELAFEEHRYWDVRRWKIAEQTENITVMGVSITQDNNGNNLFSYVPADGPDIYPQRVFQSWQYFWPIMRSEILANPNLKQNPGYN